jgi:hypothetical protein
MVAKKSLRIKKVCISGAVIQIFMLPVLEDGIKFFITTTVKHFSVKQVGVD